MGRPGEIITEYDILTLLIHMSRSPKIGIDD